MVLGMWVLGIGHALLTIRIHNAMWKVSPPTGLVSGSVVRGPVAPDPDRVNCCRSLDNTVSASGLRLLGSKVEER